MKSINGVVLHRTVSSTASSAITTAKRHKGVPGFHFVVDKDGSTTQLVNLENRANHVGKKRGDSGISNFNSIGIEVVGLPVDKEGIPTLKDSDIAGWQDLTSEQIESVAQGIIVIMDEFGLSVDNIHVHEDVSYKTKGEGQTVYDAVIGRVNEVLIQQKEAEIQQERDDQLPNESRRP